MRARIITAAVLGLAVSAALRAEPALSTVDLAGRGPLFLGSLDIGLQDPLLGAQAFLSGRRILGFLLLEGSAGYSFPIGEDLESSGAQMLGKSGPRAEAGLGFRFASGTRRAKYFYAVSSYQSSYNTRTYRGYELPYTEHLDHYLGVAARLENTGVLAEYGSVDPISSLPRYKLAEGLALYINPRYTLTGEHRFAVGSGSAEPTDQGYWSFSIGPALTPNLSQYGGLADFSIVKDMGSGLSLDIRASVGIMARDSLPDGYAIYTGDYPEEWKSSDGLDGLYIPYRLSFGITLPVYGK